MSFSVSYPQNPYPSAFGKVTAKSNFCEEDFVVTGYAGELVNAISSVAYIWLAAQGLRQLPKDSALDAKILYYGLALVGVCSGLFHALLKYHAQMSDDMSMIVATSCVLHRAMTFQQSETYTRKFTTVLLASMIIETVYHSAMNEEFVHQASWLVLLVLVARKTRALIQQRAKTPEQKQTFSRLIAFGTASMALGYFLWQLDGIFCSELTASKRSIGMPWGFLLEMHAWWHLFTAIGAYVFMVMVDSLTRDVIELPGWRLTTPEKAARNPVKM